MITVFTVVSPRALKPINSTMPMAPRSPQLGWGLRLRRWSVIGWPQSLQITPEGLAGCLLTNLQPQWGQPMGMRTPYRNPSNPMGSEITLLLTANILESSLAASRWRSCGGPGFGCWTEVGLFGERITVLSLRLLWQKTQVQYYEA